ncbi:ABC transporter ATP-binding protein [Planomonospora parontospora subsp. parontospora]|uniref:ABC transporter ATP-binding protein n=2 Tax=Planomonospora parontospora TaxID=58119 RepID=A0AA37F771_9ACTN|nr:ATP-binding cassette domain-containing protein [Planomonospora parontospora]GGK90062.1 ABC transporter ATP-binding protein [Planomonospora parontospora]GII11686.1 ABC transporter ATP-binding protein [Planomonospora parontospora subsp. parontospora]
MIDVDGLTVAVPGRTLLDGVGLTLPAAETLALVGASGSGKTTTALALLGEYPPGARVTGRVSVAGREVTPAQPPPPGTVAFIPQHPSAVLNPVLRIGTVLRQVAARHGGDVRDALHRARLPGDRAFLRRFPHQLSGGQQQRLVLAHALLTGPSVIVADEPTTGQDAVTRAEVAAELSGLGVAVVLLSHDLDLVRELADRVVVLKDGRVVESGPAVLDAPRSDYARALVTARPRAAAARRDLRAEPPLLQVAGLGTEVLREVDLDAARGERLAVVGRSGSGKTTLARCIAGLRSWTSGTVRLAGRPLPRSPRRRGRADLARVQYVFQDARASFDPRRAVVEQVARTAVRLRGRTAPAAREEAFASLASLGLDHQAALRRPDTLSGGELQRAALARALLARPDVLICDEITSGLDPVTQAEALDLLTGLDLTLIVISHDLPVAARIADRVAVVHEGRLVEHGPSGQVLNHPSHPVTRALTGLTGESSRAAGDPPRPRTVHSEIPR